MFDDVAKLLLPSKLLFLIMLELPLIGSSLLPSVLLLMALERNLPLWLDADEWPEDYRVPKGASIVVVTIPSEGCRTVFLAVAT